MSETHASVWELAQSVALDKLWEQLKSNAENPKAKTSSPKTARKGLESYGAFPTRTFLLLNPRGVESNDKVGSPESTGKSSILFNCVEVLYEEAYAAHISESSETFINCGGIRGLLLFLKLLVDSDLGSFPSQTLVTKVLNLLDLLLGCKRAKMSLRLVLDDVFIRLRFLLEKLAAKNAGGLNHEVRITASKILGTLSKQYPSSVDKYVEHIALNFDIWGHSASTVQSSAIDALEQTLLQDIDKIFGRTDMVDYLLNSIERLSQGNKAGAKANVEALSRIATKLMIDNLSEGSLKKFVGYLSLPQLRQRFPCFDPSLGATLKIFLEVFATCTFCAK